jgi:uncharacterized protein involved in response to NO
MDDISPDDIARIEERIEALRDSVVRCRKVSLAARLMIGAGAVWLALTVLALVPLLPAVSLAAIAGVIGGVVLAGSNATTLGQTEAQLQASEAMRAQWIDRREMRLVGDSPTVH